MLCLMRSKSPAAPPSGTSTSSRPKRRVLVSWVGRDNDPFNKPRTLGSAPTPGPTLTLLFDAASEFVGTVDHVVLFWRATGDAADERPLAETTHETKTRAPSIEVWSVPWNGPDPTDHRDIFQFLQLELPKVRQRFPEHELILHASPGTPAMHTIMVLMAETGYVAPPFRLVKSYRPEDRRGRPPIADIRLDVSTFYKVFQEASATHSKSSTDPGPDPQQLRSRRMRALFDDARRFARLNVPILILGERGTGKSTLARWVRSTSPFRKPSLDTDPPAVACGQYSPDTMRSELFGHVKNSFTGATADHDGLLVRADGDTLFLDEIGDVSRDLQRLLMKALEEHRFQPFGSTKTRTSHFRLVAATNRPFHELSSVLDADFLDRISHFRLEVPPLREVPEELPPFWSSAWKTACARTGMSRALGVAADKRIVKALEHHPLPGNWRDLLRLAWHLLAFLEDPYEPIQLDVAINRSLEAITPTTAKSTDLNRTLAMGFARGDNLDALLPQGIRLSPKALVSDIQAWLGVEIPRVAKLRRLSVKDMCDVSDRSLREWKSSSATTED